MPRPPVSLAAAFPALAAITVIPLLAFAPGSSRARPAPAPEPAPLRYTLGLLHRGPAWTRERTPHTDSIQAGHMANMARMAKLGALVAAGPFVEDSDLLGVFVFAPGQPPEADPGALDTLLAQDPAIAGGRIDCRLATWIAPPGLGADYRRRAEALERNGEKAPDSMVTFTWVMLHRGKRYDARPTPAVERLIARHHAYAERLRASGQLVYAGAIEGTGDLRGVLVMQGDSAAVDRAVREDPGVRAARFAPRILHWWTAWGTIPGH